MELDIWTVIFSIANFILLLFLLKTFLFKPVLKMLNERKAGIDEALAQAEQARLEVAATGETIRADIARAHADAEAILAEAKSRGESVRNEIISAARAEADSLIENARLQINQEKDQAIRDLKSQIADMAILATEKLLADGLTVEQENALMNKYIKEVGHLQ